MGRPLNVLQIVQLTGSNHATTPCPFPWPRTRALLRSCSCFRIVSRISFCRSSSFAQTCTLKSSTCQHTQRHRSPPHSGVLRFFRKGWLMWHESMLSHHWRLRQAGRGRGLGAYPGSRRFVLLLRSQCCSGTWWLIGGSRRCLGGIRYQECVCWFANWKLIEEW